MARVRGGEEWPDLVRDRSPALLRTAVLLTGDRRSAQDLVETVLARAGRSTARSADPAVLLRRRLVRAYLDPVRRWARDRQVVDSAPAQRGPDDRDRELQAALLALDPRTRAALVLRQVDGLDETAIAALVGPRRDVAALLARGRTALQPWLAGDPVPGAPPADPEQVIGARLAGLADELTWLDPTVSADDVRARRRRQRRTRAGIAAALTVAAAVGVAVPVLRDGPVGTGDDRAAPTTSLPSTPTEPPADRAGLEATTDLAEAELELVITLLDPPVVLTSPLSWSPVPGDPASQAYPVVDDVCPDLARALALNLRVKIVTSPGNELDGPRGPLGCSWASASDATAQLHLGFVDDRTTLDDVAAGLPEPLDLASCVQVSPPGGGLLLGCPDASDTAFRLVLTVPDSRGLGFFVLAATAGANADGSSFTALLALVDAVREIYGA